MTDPGRGAVRVVRGIILAAACVAISLGAHVAAEGAVHLSGPGLFYAGLLGVLCVAAADRQRGFGGILAVTAASQVVFHLFASGHHGAAAGAITPAMAGLHLGAAVVLSAVLAGGERLVWALRRLLSALSRVPRPLALPVDPPLTTPRERLLLQPRPQPVLGGPTTRGPPALLS